MRRKIVLLVCMSLFFTNVFAEDTVKILFKKGNEAGEANRHEEAIFYYKQVIDKRPELAKVHLNLGVSYMSLNKFKDAVDAFKQAISIKANYILGKVLQGTIDDCGFEFGDIWLEGYRFTVGYLRGPGWFMGRSHRR